MQRRREGRKALTTRRVTVAPIYEEHAQFRANCAVNNGTLGTALGARGWERLASRYISTTPGQHARGCCGRGIVRRLWHPTRLSLAHV